MGPLVVDDVAPFTDWPAAVRGALAVLHSTVGLDVWMLTHVEGDRQVVLYAHPRELVRSQTSIPWNRSFCRKMVMGAGPRVSTVTAATPEYANLGTGLISPVAAYLGVPLVTRSRTVFGTLCGVSSRAQPRKFVRNLATVELIARLLSSLLPEDSAPLPPLDDIGADRPARAAQPGQGGRMTTPDLPQPRDIALEQETPEQAEALEAASEPEAVPEDAER